MWKNFFSISTILKEKFHDVNFSFEVELKIVPRTTLNVLFLSGHNKFISSLLESWKRAHKIVPSFRFPS